MTTANDHPEEDPAWLQWLRYNAWLDDPANPYNADDFHWFIAYGTWAGLPVWEFEQWIRLHHALTPFAQAVTGRMAGRADVSHIRGPRDGDRLPLGRIGWSIKSQRKWTFGIDGKLDALDHKLWGVTFQCPGPSIQANTGQPPEFRCEIMNLGHEVNGTQAIFVLLKAELFESQLRAAALLAKTIYSLFFNIEFGQQRRPWRLLQSPWNPHEYAQDAGPYLFNMLLNEIQGGRLPALDQLDHNWIRIKAPP